MPPTSKRLTWYYGDYYCITTIYKSLIISLQFINPGLTLHAEKCKVPPSLAGQKPARMGDWQVVV